MAQFPNYPLNATKTNETLQNDDHPAHHNGLAAAANFLQGLADSLQTQITAIATSGSDATAVAAALAAHKAATSGGEHHAGAISITPFTGVAGPDLQTALSQIFAAIGSGGGGTPHAVTSPDDSVQHIYLMTKAAWDAIAPGTAGNVYITYPEA